jgi:hypothetical protein
MIAAYLKKTPEEVALATTFNALKVKCACFSNSYCAVDPDPEGGETCFRSGSGNQGSDADSEVDLNKHDKKS